MTIFPNHQLFQSLKSGAPSNTSPTTLSTTGLCLIPTNVSDKRSLVSINSAQKNFVWLTQSAITVYRLQKKQFCFVKSLISSRSTHKIYALESVDLQPYLLLAYLFQYRHSPLRPLELPTNNTHQVSSLLSWTPHTRGRPQPLGLGHICSTKVTTKPLQIISYHFHKHLETTRTKKI